MVGHFIERVRMSKSRRIIEKIFPNKCIASSGCNGIMKFVCHRL